MPDILVIGFVKHHDHMGRHARDAEASTSSADTIVPVGLFGIAEEQKPCPVSDCVRHRLKIVPPLLQRDDDRLSVGCRDLHFVYDEGLIGHDCFIARRLEMSGRAGRGFHPIRSRE